MKAMQITRLGKPLKLRSIPCPSPAPGEIRIKVHFAGINFADLLIAKGSYQVRPELPFTLGMEASGTVDALGEGVSNIALGDRVAAFGTFGALAEFACYAASHCVRIPEDMPFEHAACFMVAYGTSHVALDYRAQIQPGERLLVLGASGGVGRTAVEIGRLLGAQVIAAARGPKKLEVARAAGAHVLIDTREEDLRTIVKGLGGADVVYNPVGGDTFKEAMRATRPDGRIIPVGFASGVIPRIPANILLVKNVTVIGLFWGAYLNYKPGVLTESLTQLMTWYEEGRLSPHISAKVPLAEAEDALDLLRDRAAIGRVIVRV